MKCLRFEPRPLHIICNIPTNWAKLTEIIQPYFICECLIKIHVLYSWSGGGFYFYFGNYKCFCHLCLFGYEKKLRIEKKVTEILRWDKLMRNILEREVCLFSNGQKYPWIKVLINSCILYNLINLINLN